MRVLMTIDAVGGVWRYAMELAAASHGLGIEVVFAGLGPRPAPDQLSEGERLGDLIWLDEPLDWMAAEEGDLDTLPLTLGNIVERFEVDLVHLNVPSQACGLSLPVPVLVASHSCTVTWWLAMRREPFPGEWQWQKRRNLEGFRRANAIVTPTRSQAALLEQCYGPLPALKVIANSVASFPRGEMKEDFVFAAARWWDDGKNARVLDAAAQDAPWPVIMAGAIEGPGGQRCNIRFARALGEIPHTEILQYMRRAAVFVSPSLYEPFGLAALEAARSGAALLLADIPTYRELWDGAAIFFNPHRPESLCAALNDLRADADLRSGWGERAHTRSLRFLPAVQAQAMAALYRGLTSEAGVLPIKAPVEA